MLLASFSNFVTSKNYSYYYYSVAVCGIMFTFNGPRVRKQINCASMQKVFTKCARQKVLKYLNYLHIEPYKQDKNPPKEIHTRTHKERVFSQVHLHIHIRTHFFVCTCVYLFWGVFVLFVWFYM